MIKKMAKILYTAVHSGLFGNVPHNLLSNNRY